MKWTSAWMSALALLLWLGGCGGERNMRHSLQAPGAAVADAARCAGDEARPLESGPLEYRQVQGQCLRSSSALDAPETALGARKRALATAPSRLVTADELFNWAERTYPEYFPSARSTQRLDQYRYRFYPESDNHAALGADGRVYVQGPMSGGGLVFVGTLQDFSCRVLPSLCGGTQPADCSPIAQWSAGSSQCTPNPGQTARIADGVLYTFIDSVGLTTGAASYRCNNGTLVASGAPTCETATTLPCDTSTLSWTVGGNQCQPNGNEPLSIVSGSSYSFVDSSGTNGRATYTCNNGTLSGPSSASCNPAPSIDCRPPANLSWTVAGETCQADPISITSVANNAALFVVDSDGTYTGSASFRCAAGTLLPEGELICAIGARVRDSFGGDGGAADGDASGDGTAADGAPIVGATVRIVDINGRQANAVTDSRGYWRTKLRGMIPPLLVTVTRPDGRVRRSVSLKPLRANTYVFIAVTGLTDKLVSDLALAAGFTNPGALTPTMVQQLGASVVADRLQALRNNSVVRVQLQAAGLEPDTFDPLNTPFRADRTGYDRVLDNLVVTSLPDGRIEVRAANCTVGGVSWTVAGATCSLPNVSLQLAPGTQFTFNDQEAPTFGSATFACSSSGGLIGPTNAICYVSTQKD